MIQLSIGLKIIRHALSESQFLTEGTTQYFGSQYYGQLVWYDSLLKKHKQIQGMLDTLGRAHPLAFANYSLGAILSKHASNAYQSSKINKKDRKIKREKLCIPIKKKEK